MNKHQRRRSREIKAIANADKWGKTTYKEAKRKWKKNIRAFPVGRTTEWVVADLSYLKLSQQRMDELGWAVRYLIHHANEKNMTLDIVYAPCIGAYKLTFRSNPLILQNRFGYTISVTADLIRWGVSPITVAGHIVKDMDYGLSKLSVDTTAKIEPSRVVFDERLIFDPTIVFDKDGSFRITEVSLIGRR